MRKQSVREEKIKVSSFKRCGTTLLCGYKLILYFVSSLKFKLHSLGVF